MGLFSLRLQQLWFDAGTSHLWRIPLGEPEWLPKSWSEHSDWTKSNLPMEHVNAPREVVRKLFMHTSRKPAPKTASALCVPIDSQCKSHISTTQWHKAGVPFSCVAATNMNEHMLFFNVADDLHSGSGNVSLNINS